MKKKREAVGRKLALSTRQRRQIVRLSTEGNHSLNQLGNKYGVSPMTIYRVIKKGQVAVSEPETCSDGVTDQPQAAEHDTFPRVYSSYG